MQNMFIFLRQYKTMCFTMAPVKKQTPNVFEDCRKKGAFVADLVLHLLNVFLARSYPP